MKISVIVPVYRSEAVVGEMIERTLAVLDSLSGGGELVLVNDASPDGSWEVLSAAAARDPRVVALDLAHNVGQHRALMVGLRRAQGDWIATLDDDLQNPPEELPALVAAGEAGHDLVFGRFRVKQHAAPRVAGSRVVTWLNRALYGLPRGMRVSNVRLIARAVVERMLALDGGRIYVTGLALWCARSPVEAEVEHAPRAAGASTYTPAKLARLFASILLAHPRFPWPRGSPPRDDELVRETLSAAPRPLS